PHTVLSTRSLHDALPIFVGNLDATGDEHAGCSRRRTHDWRRNAREAWQEEREPSPVGVLIDRPASPDAVAPGRWDGGDADLALPDRKSTRLNSSHQIISY